jgi:hypothetical protein
MGLISIFYYKREEKKVKGFKKLRSLMSLAQLVDIYIIMQRIGVWTAVISLIRGISNN